MSRYFGGYLRSRKEDHKVCSCEEKVLAMVQNSKLTKVNGAVDRIVNMSVDKIVDRIV